MSFDSADGKLWCADVGLVTREEINHITRGANYGWEYREGLVAGPRPGPAPAGAQFTDPIWDYPTSQGFSITGGFVYRGTKFPDLVGHYLFSDYVTGRLWALVDNGARPLPATQVRQLTSEIGITGFALDPRTGDVLLADYDSNMIRRLASNPNVNGTPLPATLAGHRRVHQRRDSHGRARRRRLRAQRLLLVRLREKIPLVRAARHHLNFRFLQRRTVVAARWRCLDKTLRPRTPPRRSRERAPGRDAPPRENRRRSLRRELPIEHRADQRHARRR